MHTLKKPVVLPPHSLEMERAVLNALMIDPGAIMMVAGRLRAGMFFDRRHQIVYAAIQRLFSMSEPIDVLTIHNELIRFKELEAAGGDPYIASLTGEVATSAHVEHYASQVVNYYALRRLQWIGSDIYRAIEEETDAGLIVSDMMVKLSNIHLGISGNEFVDSGKLTVDTLQAIDETVKNKGVSPRFIKSGYTYLDQHIGGFEAGTLSLLAARTRVGKTDMMLNMVLNISKSKSVGILSLEMKDVALMRRMLANYADINRLDMRTGNLENTQLDDIAKSVIEIGRRKIYIIDTPGMTALDVRSKITLLQKKHGIDIVFIDHLHRIRFKNETRKTHDSRRDVAEVLADTARGLDLPIVCLAQLNRENARQNVKPVLEQIRDAGEDDADVVLMLWRAGAYEYPVEDNLEIVICKARDGSSGVVHCHYDLTTGKIIQIDKNEAPPKPTKESTNDKEDLPF